ncbi:MAG TPA: hypothetical protein VF519_10030, partial [Mycobacteriales bacterium]
IVGKSIDAAGLTFSLGEMAKALDTASIIGKIDHTALDAITANLGGGLNIVGKSIDAAGLTFSLGEMAKALDTASIIGKIDHTALDAIAANLGGGLDIVGKSIDAAALVENLDHEAIADSLAGMEVTLDVAPDVDIASLVGQSNWEAIVESSAREAAVICPDTTGTDLSGTDADALALRRLAAAVALTHVVALTVVISAVVPSVATALVLLGAIAQVSGVSLADLVQALRTRSKDE